MLRILGLEGFKEVKEEEESQRERSQLLLPREADCVLLDTIYTP